MLIRKLTHLLNWIVHTDIFLPGMVHIYLWKWKQGKTDYGIQQPLEHYYIKKTWPAHWGQKELIKKVQEWEI